VQLTPQIPVDRSQFRFRGIRHQHRHVEVAIPLGLATWPRAEKDDARRLRDFDSKLYRKVDLLLRRAEGSRTSRTFSAVSIVAPEIV
jgi:hypothetical protein